MLEKLWHLYSGMQKESSTLNSCLEAQQRERLLRPLRKALRKKRPGHLWRGVILQHNNATPHSTRRTQELLQSFRWELLDHPPYSPDLAPPDFHLFGPLKQHLGGRLFHNNEEVEIAVDEWLRMQKPNFYRDGIFKLVPRWDKCINVLGDYIEK
jgi:hypothetical protein